MAVTPELRVRVGGCLSLDSPIESSLRYLLQEDGGSERFLDISWREGLLELHVSVDSKTDEATNGVARRVPLLTDPDGRAAAPDIGARMDPESSDEREVEHFLRRLVRAAFA